MNLRNMFQTVFGKQKEPSNVTQYRFLNNYSPLFTTFNGNMYDSDIVRTCIDAIARNAAKLKPKHIRRANGEITELSDALQWLLSVRPNPYMSTYDFLYKIVSQLYANNNSFVYIQLDQTGAITGLYPLSFSSLEFVEYEQELYCRFSFLTGFRITIPYTYIQEGKNSCSGTTIEDDEIGRMNIQKETLVEEVFKNGKKYYRYISKSEPDKFSRKPKVTEKTSSRVLPGIDRSGRAVIKLRSPG